MFSIVALMLGIVGTVIMAKGLLMDDETISRVSGTYYGKNPHFKKKLREDRRDAKIGLFLLFLSFVFQFIDEILLIIV